MSFGYLEPPASPAASSCSSTDTEENSVSIMSSPQSTPSDRAMQPYTLVPNLHIADPSAGEIDLNSHPWMVATVIEDDDLTFGGKPLSTWYEEDRRRLSYGKDEEERRGRQRERVTLDSHHHHHHHHHHHQHKQQATQHTHAKKTSAQ